MLTIVVQTVDALDTESFGVSSTAVSESVVEHAVVDRVGEFGGWPGHSGAMWPFRQHLKQRPSFLNCTHSLSVSFVNGARVCVASTSIGTILLLFVTTVQFYFLFLCLPFSFLFTSL